LIFVALIGATLLLVRGAIFAPVRRLWPALFGCAQCAGFWAGVLGGASGLAEAAGRSRALDAIVLGCAVSIGALLTDAVLLRLLGDPHAADRPIAADPSIHPTRETS
jgi:hypothetical protein